MVEQEVVSSNLGSNNQMNGSKLVPPNKLNEGHNVFMTNMSSNSVTGSPKKHHSNSNIVGINNVEVLNLNNSNSNSNNLNSTKVIESLHDQIDSMTNANVQLTLQSQSLLTKLESLQMKEIKLQEQITSLKIENENVNQILNRKTRKLKDLESEYSLLNVKASSLENENKALNSKCDSINESELKLKEHLQMVENQYNTIYDSHEYYKEKYTLEISNLTDELENTKKDQLEFFKGYQQQNKNINDSIQKFNVLIKNLNDANVSFNNLLNNKCNETIEQLNLNAWIELYKESKELVVTYAQEMNLTIPQKFNDLAEDETLQKLESNLTSNKPPPLNLNPINNTIASFNKNHNNNENFRYSNNNHTNHNIHIAQNHDNVDQIPLIKLRNTSQNTGTNSNPNSPNPNNKRSSFYGGTKAMFSPSNSTLPGTLPGVKRSSSIRKTSSRISSMKADNSNNNNNNGNSGNNGNNSYHNMHSHKRNNSLSSSHYNIQSPNQGNASPRITSPHQFSNDTNNRDFSNSSNKSTSRIPSSSNSSNKKKRNSMMFS